MKFITSLFGSGSPKAMGRQYMKVGRNALFGLRTEHGDNICADQVPKPLSLLISRKGKLRHGESIGFIFQITFFFLRMKLTDFANF